MAQFYLQIYSLGQQFSVQIDEAHIGSMTQGQIFLSQIHGLLSILVGVYIVVMLVYLYPAHLIVLS